MIYGNSQGLANDAQVIIDALSGEKIKIATIRQFSGSHSKLQNVFALCSLLLRRYVLRQMQISIHLEELHPEILYFSNRNVLIPNQEWLRSKTAQRINDDIHVWCKTKYAQRKLGHLSKNTRFIGFCSRNLDDVSIEANYNKFLHVAGKSEQKGTISLLDVWRRHPEWPELTVISRIAEHKEYNSGNINIISEFLSEQVLQRVMNEHGVHLCPSESEGFGHNIVEALSVGAVVLTTDAPPMNELVDSEFGYLVPASKSGERYYSELFKVDEVELDRAITYLTQKSDELKTNGKNIKQRYSEKRREFRSNIESEITKIICH